MLTLRDRVSRHEGQLGRSALDIVGTLDEPQGNIVEVLGVPTFSKDERVVLLRLLLLRLPPLVWRVPDQVDLVASTVRANQVPVDAGGIALPYTSRRFQ